MKKKMIGKEANNSNDIVVFFVPKRIGDFV